MDDKEKDFESAFNNAYDLWFPWMSEAHKDFKYVIDDPWTEEDKQYFRDADREVLNFNITRRIVKMITGYERRNRLSLKIGPSEGSDDKVASQLTGVVMPLMENKRGYEVMSDAFEMGAVITGANLVEPYFDRQGNIQFARKPYNKFLLDPHFFKRDLSDCKYIIIHEEGMLTEDIKTLLLGKGKLIEEYAKQPGGEMLPFSAYKGRGREDGTRANYSAFWKRTTKKIKMVGNRQSGQKFEWQGTQKLLKELMSRYPLQLVSWDEYKDTVELDCFVNGRLVRSGPDPNKIDDYPHILVAGFWYPEYDDMSKKLQGEVRPLRDPQREVSKRISKILDIIDSQVSSGMIAEEGTLVDKDDIHASGQGKGIWVKEGKWGKIEFKQSADIPAGLFQLNHDLQEFINLIAGVNESMFGTEELNAQVSGYLLKLRQGAGLVALQDLFDNLRFSKKQLGFKLIKMIQANYRPHKILRIINEPPVQQFYSDDLNDYDIVPQEGILTETQRQMAYVELRQLKKDEAPIPWSVIFEFMPLQLKDKFKQIIKQGEQAQAQARAEEAQEKKTTEQMKQAKMAADFGRAEERKANVGEHHADAALARVKTMKELDQMDWDKVMGLLDRLAALEKGPRTQGMTKR